MSIEHTTACKFLKKYKLNIFVHDESQEKDGVPVTALREINILMACRHPNIVELRRVVTGAKRDAIFLVFEYCEHDLARLVDARKHAPFTEAEVKQLAQQLLGAVAFLHARAVVHRDLKLSNLLYTRRGELKLCDFGYSPG